MIAGHTNFATSMTALAARPRAKGAKMNEAQAAVHVEAALAVLADARRQVDVARQLQAEAVERRLVAEHARLARRLVALG